MIEREEIEQAYWTKKEIKDEDVGKRLVQLFLERDDELKPAYWYGSDHTNDKNIKFDSEIQKKFMSALLDFTENHGILNNTHYGFSGSNQKKSEFAFNIDLGVVGDMFNTFSFRITHEYFISQERIDKFLTLGKEIILLLNPFYGKIHDIGDSVNSHKRGTTYNVLEKIPRIYWGNYFGDMYIERIGEEKLLSFNAYKTEKIGNGIYMQLSNSPLEFDSNECKQTRKKLESHIGKQCFGYEEHKTINELFRR